MKKNKDSKTVKDLKADLDNAYREMADGVRDLINLRVAYSGLNKENTALRGMLIQSLCHQHGITVERASVMMNDMLPPREDN